jgi:Family of unknown function (DUF6789)
VSWGLRQNSKFGEMSPSYREEIMMAKNLLKGVVAGFVATLVLSVLMILKARMGLLPGFNVIAMLAKVTGTGSPVVGWVAHFGIGAVLWGALFAWLDPNLPGGSHWIKGVIFGCGAWLLMMVLFMPLAGAGFFAIGLGPRVAVMTLALHVIYGGVIGATYGFEQSAVTRSSPSRG